MVHSPQHPVPGVNVKNLVIKVPSVNCLSRNVRVEAFVVNKDCGATTASVTICPSTVLVALSMVFEVVVRRLCDA